MILFVVLFFLGCFAQLIIYPFYWIVIYADIVYLSIIAVFVFMIIGFYVLKKYHRLDRLSIVTLIGGGIIFLGFSAYMEASFFIWNVAKEKHHSSLTGLHINLSKWTDFSFFDRADHGCTHAEIEIDGQRYYWSFNKKDFVKAEDNLMRCD
ncbi:hypothetical protein [Sulfuricurvum sp.]|uniref:hypothetical protein n=1 Tax=Sulfuricurvum sp. TaxID=2025608 RepID=UPI002E312DE6|nr:hypothetical protein [Sulfuricurvum sp.]HEX5329373.1 hypothetical protein [Sulfuricurvum sp.]